jgi:hypothetical protein
MARNKKSGEPGTPLIIALVFFILLSIGLGVMYYLGLSDTAAEKAKADEAANKAKAADKAMKEAQDQAKLYRAFLGTATAEESAYIQNPAPETKDAVRAEHTKLMGAMNERVAAAANRERTALEKVGAGFDFKAVDAFTWAWPANGALPASPSPAPLADRMVKFVAERELAVKQAATEVQAARNELTALSAEKKRYTDAIADLTKKLDEAITGLTTAKTKGAEELAAAIKVFESASGDQRKTARDTAQKVEEVTAKNNELLAELTRLREEVNRTREAQDEINQEKKGVFAQNVPHGSVTVRRDGGNTVEINLGSADNLKEGTTFAVQPHDAETLGLDRKRNVVIRDRDGRALGQAVKSYREVPKGKLEVVRVIGPRQSLARITEEVDEVRDSIFKGDLLYNPLWKKGARDHVVLFGIFDTNADGIDDIKTVAADLQRRGVTVDGYYDLASRKWESLDPKNKTPGPTQTTTYAVKGWIPEPSATSSVASGTADLVNAIATAAADAKAKGVQEVRANRFFPEIGYQLSVGISNDTVNQAAIKFIKEAPATAAPMDK